MKKLKYFLFVCMCLAVNADALAAPRLEKATFAGGCFWCVESGFEEPHREGISEVLSGYEGGSGESATYRDYAEKGHIEVVQVEYDPAQITYPQLLDIFWRQIDPTDPGGQFVDRGPQYRSAIFYHNEEQRKLAEDSKDNLSKTGPFSKSIVTEILSASEFFEAEPYHQNYHKEHNAKYKFYRFASGRDQFLKKVWGDSMKVKNEIFDERRYVKPSDEVLKKTLSDIQYKVTQKKGTERPFDNIYANNHEAGIYVDVVSGEPLFSSLDKYDSGTGWPSFSKLLEPDNVVEKEDRSFFSSRTEIRSKHADSHLGHVFSDGPEPTGLRYCMNSAALRFVAAQDLEREGYGQYKDLLRSERT